MIQKKLFLVVAMCIFALSSAMAQVTTSAMSGIAYSGTKSETIIGATVIATHVPSGTRYHAITNVNGRFTIQGMRTGGPYKVEVSYVGYKKQTFNNIFLELGNTYQLDANMKESAELNEVVVMGVGAKKSFTGAGQNFATAKISSTPTVDRSIYDIVKNMPMAQTNKIGGISFAGSNNRYNSFQIDGTMSNDVFGLASTGTNGGQTGANPISMDAIQEIQVVVSPFDVRQSGFTGGGINAITKQGTNQFHGSVYDFYTNQKLYGTHNSSNKYAKEKLDKQHTNTFGFTLGGPIIKDKLFFFTSFEHLSQSYPSRYFPGRTDYLTEANAKAAVEAYQKYTGITESYGARDVDQSSSNFMARIDWNINTNNKFALRYQYNNSSSDVYSSGNSSYYFNNSAYTMKNKTNSFVAELNSHISEALYNEARASMTFVRDHREVPYQGPCVMIYSNKANDDVAMYMGTEYSSGANKLNQNIYTIEDNLSWYKGNHTFTFGTHNEIFHMENQFVQANNGEWVYSSLTNFLNDSPTQFVYKYTDPAGFIPSFNAGQFGLYAQDKWDVTKNLALTLGLRVDMPKVFDDPTTNDEFNTHFAAYNKLDAKVGRMPSMKLMFSPRFGFRYFVDDAHNTLLRGGIGLFTGRVPFVWLSNAFTNDGIEQKGTTINKSVPSLAAYANNPSGAANSVTGTSAKPDICTVDKNFKYPQVFRTDLALEQKLPFDMKLTLEGLYSKTLNNVYFKNLALESNGFNYVIAGNEKTAVPAYKLRSGDDTQGYYSIIDLENTSKGYTYSLSATLEKTFNFGLNASLSYTYGHSKSIYDGTSSVAYSNWKYNYAYDSNNPGLSYSTFDIPNRIVFNLGYTTPKYLNDILSTDVSLIYTGSNGMRFSLTMNESADFNGDGQKGNTVLYIPTSDEIKQMNFTDEANRTSFENWIDNNNYAKNHRGQFSKRNCCQAPWENRIDLHLAENIFVMKAWGSKLQLTCDIINFANMLNKHWGISYASAYNVTPLNYAYNKTAAAYQYSYNTKGTVTRSDIYSRWHMQIGAKIVF